jgi:hypothetical protein
LTLNIKNLEDEDDDEHENEFSTSEFGIMHPHFEGVAGK